MLNAVTLLEELQRRHPGQYDTGVLRTLQRRMRQWRAVHGAERDIYFAQEHPPGRLGCRTSPSATNSASRSTALRSRIGCTSSRSPTRAGAMPRSVVGGESFIALSTGLQAALWRLGGVPEEHRTDSLSAAFNNLAEQADADAPLRRAVPPLRHARQPLQPGPVARERLHRVAP